MAFPREVTRKVSEILASKSAPQQQLDEMLELAVESLGTTLFAIHVRGQRPLWQRERITSKPATAHSSLPPFVDIVTAEPHPLTQPFVDALSVILRRITHFAGAEEGNRLIAAHRALMVGAMNPDIDEEELLAVFSNELQNLANNNPAWNFAPRRVGTDKTSCDSENDFPQEYRTLCSLLRLGITAKNAERARQNAPIESRIFAELDLGLLILDEQGFVIAANRSAATTIRATQSGLVGKHYAEVISPIADEDLAKPLASYWRDGSFGPMNVMLRQSTGRAIAIEFSFSRINFHGAIAHVVTMRDIDTRNHDVADWRWRATHDSLTGLLNREGLAQAILSLKCSDVMVLYLDLDGFKAVNDSLGHAAGDQVITGVASTLVKSVKNDDLIARVGGDEFVVIGDAPTDTRSLRRVAVRLAKALANTPIKVGETQIAVTAAIGATIEPRHPEIPTLLQRADRLMITAKRSPARHRVMAEPIPQLDGYDDFASHWDPYRLEIFGGFRSKGIIPAETIWVDASGKTDSIDLELEWAKSYTETVRGYALRHQLGISYNQWLYRYLANRPLKERFVSVAPIEPNSRFVDRLFRLAQQLEMPPSGLQLTFDSGDLADTASFERAIKTAKHCRSRAIRTAIRWQSVIGGEISHIAQIEPTLLQVDLDKHDSRNPDGRMFTALAAFCDKLGAELRVSGYLPGSHGKIAELAERYPSVRISLQAEPAAR